MRWLLLHFLLQLLDASFNPWMSKCVLGCHSFIRFPFEAVIDKVDEVTLILICLHQLCQVLGVYRAHFPFRIRLLERAVVVVEEDFAPRGNNYHGSRRDTFDFHDALHLLFFILAGKDWETDEEFVEDATEGPHVDGWCVADAHHNFRGTIKSRLDVGVELILLIGAGAEINDFYTTLIALSQKDVFWFHIAMDDTEFFHIMERDKDLNCKAAHEPL